MWRCACPSRSALSPNCSSSGDPESQLRLDRITDGLLSLRSTASSATVPTSRVEASTCAIVHITVTFQATGLLVLNGMSDMPPGRLLPVRKKTI